MYPVDVFPLTGLAGDFLNCIETSIILEKPDDYAWFPMTYGDEYESISKITNDALLTVSAFGSNQVKFATETTTNSIVSQKDIITLLITKKDYP